MVMPRLDRMMRTDGGRKKAAPACPRCGMPMTRLISASLENKGLACPRCDRDALPSVVR